MYGRVIAIKEARFGAGSATLAIPLNNHATVLGASGRPHEAVAELERALGVLAGVVDEDHPGLRAIRRNLARLEAVVGDLNVNERHGSLEMGPAADPV